MDSNSKNPWALIQQTPWAGIITVWLAVTSTPSLGQTGTGASFQTVQGQHIVLKADWQDRASLQALVASFDAAVPQWERFWNLPAGTLDDWTVRAFVMNDPERFRQSGDLPPGLEFPFGYARGNDLWVVRQPGEYYTRHLLLHEGVHALQLRQFGGTGPTWYAEGIAEALGVHRGARGATRVNVIPESRESVPYWGRFKRLDQARRKGQVPSLDTVLEYPRDLEGDVGRYGWSWLAAQLFSQYPDYRTPFLASASRAGDPPPRFNRRFRRRLQSVWPIAQARWRLLAHTVDYGFDWSRERVSLAIEDPLWRGQPLELAIRADAGWQSAGVRFPPGTRLTVTPSGRCQLDDDPKPWISEPAGVTIHYANDRPLGQLLVCLVPNVTQEQTFLKPLAIRPVSEATEITVSEHCWLLFRINDHLGHRANNQDGYRVLLERRQ
jgi:hypothetical protein